MLISTLSDIASSSGRHIAIGEFDGVHLGHRKVISGADTVLTFEPHPLKVIAPRKAPKLITPLSVKADLIKRLGVRELVVIPFNKAFSMLSPKEFVDQVVLGHLSAHTVSVGENFRFGHKALGDTAYLRQRTEFATRIEEMVQFDGEVVTSTFIRHLVSSGEIERANKLLGANFQYRGKVIHGEHRGRELNFPTANLLPNRDFLHPELGIYACRAAIERAGETLVFPAAVSIGVRPTFENQGDVLIEAHILDFAGDLYDQELRLEFISRIRGEERFDSVGELVAQIERDVEAVRAIVNAVGEDMGVESASLHFLQ